ncbi:hypothetical protein AN478_02095 [Thiohalorhabdus denitrificans]|uniref:ComF family protein n=1 Tax=Thiohalorhabdus denitrificans TaxID=381306 RepID=A0A0P9CX25_9GAMM|nr:double zinc ribbon domain-containing protein [Thiohalorhabdus denitrificans]KPV41392.1 hypothetical protein AN478_02095 [Thiohalorhabdus denitrificans]SCY25703.1 comF family protein [Thiohalorhabdus denitrificans]
MQLKTPGALLPGRLRDLVDLLYPVRCLVCGEAVPGPIRLCPACRAGLPRSPERRCPRCAYPGAAPDRPCGRCQRRPPAFQAVHAPGAYREPLAGWIRELKYGHHLGLARTLAAVADQDLGDWLHLHRFDLLVPVPLHRRRMADRGFNQALLLARLLGARHGLPVRAFALARTRPTGTQVGLADRQRTANVRDAFRARRWPVADRRVALVDDVVTTGATADAAARALLEAGAEKVGVVAVARA